MLLFALAGLWALVSGSITITASLSLEGRRARVYGATLMGLALLLFLLGPVIERITPAVLLENDAARIAVNAVLAAAVIIGLVFPFRDKAKGSTTSAPWRLIRFSHGGGRVLTILAVAAAVASLLLWYFFWRDAG